MCKGRLARLTVPLLACVGLPVVGAQAAGGVRVCVPKAEGRAIVTPVRGACRAGFTLTSLAPVGKQAREGKTGPQGPAGPEGKQGPEGREGNQGREGQNPFSAQETAVLKGLLPYITLVPSGVDGKPTIQFSGANIQIVNGEGVTESTNGAGNLIIGYDSEPGAQTGSHNLILGARQTYSSYGDIVAGVANDALSYFSTVLGAENTVSGPASSVTGGYQNGASSAEASVGGGKGNVAQGSWSSVAGGTENTAHGQESSVSGGLLNLASGLGASVSGGQQNTAGGGYASILGGKEVKVDSEDGVSP